ncbi:MAG: hypothetical protein FWC22_01030 [Treponema sp.]|nr:hypothetical protein [Treponema sp.]
MDTGKEPNISDDNNPPLTVKKQKKPKRFLKTLIILLCVIAVISITWTAFSMIGRINAALIIPDSVNVRISISNPVSFIDRALSHESLDEIASAPAFEPVISSLKDNPLLKNRLIRFIARGNVEAALLPSETYNGTFAAAWDMRLLSPMLRILPAISGLMNVKNLYYVNAGSNSRFEYRLDEKTIYIGPYRNLLLITDSRRLFESRSALNKDHEAAFNIIKPNDYDAALVLSNEFVSALLADQSEGIAAILNNIEISSRVEAGLSVFPRKLELHLAAPLSSQEQSLSRILEQRPRVPGMAERIPAGAQYATILSAGTLNDLYQTALLFTPDLNDALKTADSASRILLGISLNDILFSWTGDEFAVFGIEGRPHPVYAIQIAEEKKRDEIFTKAFKSIVLHEDIRLNLDGTRIPKIGLPDFLQSLLKKWDIYLPSPYYIIYKDYFLASESAEALLSALRAMQRNEVLPKTEEWRNIAGGRTSESAFSLYYSLDLSVPFFMKNNTAFSEFISLYRQGLVRMNINRGVVEVSLALVPGSGSGVNLVKGYPLEIGEAPSNRVYGGESGKVFYSSGNTAHSLNMSDNKIYELPNQGNHWVISSDKGGAWVVTDRGRVTLTDGEMEPANGFPLLTGIRLSSPPAAYEGRLYLCDENGRVHTIDEKGVQKDWETSFSSALRSPPSFLTLSLSRNNSKTYSSAYPKSFFAEIWLLDANGKALPNWPASISVSEDDDFGVAFGSPLLFAHNSRALTAFVNQSGQLLVYDENADLVPPFPVTLEGLFYHQPVFDGQYLWLVSSEGKLFKVDMEGEVLSQQIQDFTVMEEGYITVFDYDNDKVPEIFITGDGNALYAFTRNFRSLEGFPLPIWGKPVFIPPQGSRKAEIIGIGMSRLLYRYQFK